MKNEFSSFISNYIENLKNVNDKAKANYFMDYLRAYLKANMGEETLENPDVFSVLDKDFLLDSIESYINEKQPVKGVAKDYKRTITDLCKEVCKKNEIKNDFLESASEQDDFNGITKEWFAHLKKSESRECMSSEEVEILDEAIRAFFDTENLESKINYSIEKINSRPNHYGWLVSAIALKLIQKFGLDNGTIANLKITDLNMEDRILGANGFKLPISEGLYSNFELYLKSRILVIKTQNTETDTLFVKRTGKPYCDINGNPDSGQLFLLMDSTLNHTSTTGLRYRTIIELVSKGANINLLFQLTGVTKEKIVEICIEDKADEDESSLENIFRGVKNPYILEKKKPRKGQLQCPYCGSYNDASSENWILIQVAGEEKKYLACRECRGLDGKVRY